MSLQRFEEGFIENFGGLELDNQLFYNIERSIRFELGNPDEFGKTNYMQQVYYRSKALFNKLFDEEDYIYVIVKSNRAKDNPNKSTLIFKKYLKNSQLKYNMAFKKIIDNDLESEVNQYYLECKKSEIKYIKLLKAISNKDFNILPKLNSDDDCYFVSLKKGVIFNQYDDQGVDIVFKSNECFLEFYNEYYNWILPYDRERIDTVFKKYTSK